MVSLDSLPSLSVTDDSTIKMEDRNKDADGDTNSMTSASTSIDDRSFSRSRSSSPSAPSSAERFRFRVRSVKRVMKTLMARHGGSTRHPRVTKMIQKLETLNPTQQPAKSDYLLGDFIAHSSPDFPGRIRQPKKIIGGVNNQRNDVNQETVVQYTLGRLSFGIFQPHNLVCTVRSVRNSIQICEDSELCAECAPGTSLQSFYYPIIIDLTIHTPRGDLPAELTHDAICYEIPGNQKRLGVTFLGGSLKPSYLVRSDHDLFSLWKETFANAYKTADEERSYFNRMVRYVVHWYLKMTVPTDEDAERSPLSSVRYEMKRRPKGYLDVLYLDDELRVTRGNRGTLIVVERLQDYKSANS